MNWYLAKIVFHITSPSANLVQFDEQYRLFEAEDEYQAFVKAVHFGKKESAVIQNERGHSISWVFMGIPELSEFLKLQDGLELLARTEESAEPERYIETIGLQYEALKNRILPIALNLT